MVAIPSTGLNCRPSILRISSRDEQPQRRVKLFATALNNLGVGAIITAIVAPIVNGRVADSVHTVVWLLLGCCLIGWAQITLWRFHT